MPLQIHKSRGALRSTVRAFLIYSAVVCTAGGLGVASTSAPRPMNTAPGINANFAIADFDGDRNPDLATVEVEKAGPWSTTQYSIRFELTAGRRQVFGLTAPAGGLQIVARDVNGDNALDVLVSTTWQHTQVAVLLNDGHGKFSLADPAAFPTAFRETETVWNCEALAPGDLTALVRSAYRGGGIASADNFEKHSRQVGRARSLDVPVSSQRFLFQMLGRAPPSVVLSS
jgi:hypothetical protein